MRTSHEVEQTDREPFGHQFSDDALESAGAVGKKIVCNFSLYSCTALNFCPAAPHPNHQQN